MQRLFLAAVALAAIVALANVALAGARRVSGPRGNDGAVVDRPQGDSPMQKISFALLAALILYVSFGGG